MELRFILFERGYRLIEDAWLGTGRRTYIHDDDASRSHIASLHRLITAVG